MAFQVRVERAWGRLESATGATSLEILEQRVGSAKQDRDDLVRAMDDLLRVSQAMGFGRSRPPEVHGAWMASFQKAMAIVETGAAVKAADLASGEYATLSTTAIKAFDALVDFQNHRMTEAVAKAKADAAEGETILLATVSAALLIGLASPPGSPSRSPVASAVPSASPTRGGG